jgi:HrpA-like RNA helicase
VLEAPPGAGKTTALPLEILAADPPWLQGKALVVVEPRRLAATAAARRMVSLLQKGARGEGEESGEEEKPLRLGRGGCPIGYAVRGDARCSFRDARVVVVTPGVATRLLLDEFHAAEKSGSEDGGAPLRRRSRRLFALPIGAVMLDEAHERSAEVDLLFALLAARGGGGIKVVFASATLGGGLAEKAAARLEGGGGGGGGKGGGPAASIVRAPAARAFPVAVRFAGPPRDAGGQGGGGAASLAAAAAAEAVALLKGAGGKHAKGDVLVFLPGVADIRATRAALEKLVGIEGGEGEGERGGGDNKGESGSGSGSGRGSGSSTIVDVLQLHGGLPPSEQDRVLAPRRRDGAPRRRRRIILSTPVAESSLTVPGVTSVVDAGLSRVPRLDPSKGVERLVTLPISRSSADQRAGRAGREAPGACVRLWSDGDHSRRAAAAAPEASRGGSDLAPLALALVAADADASPSSSPPPLPWLDEPHRGDLYAGLELLELLGLISKKKEREGVAVGGETPASSPPPELHRAFELTPQGARASALGAHPRLSRMLLCAARLRCPELGAVLAAACSERDFVLRNTRGPGRGGGVAAGAPAPGASAAERVLALAGRGPLAPSVDRRAASGVLDAALVLERQLRGVASADDDPEEGGEEEPEEDDEPAVDDGDGSGDGEGLREAPPQRLRRGERRLALARAAADAVEENHVSLVGCLIASAYPDRVATRRARGGRDRSAAFVLGGGGGGGEHDPPATAVLPAGSQDPLLECPVLAVATLGTSAAAARSSSLIFLAAPLELPPKEKEGGGDEGGDAEAAEILRAVPGLLVSGERSCTWVPSAARLVCSVRTRIGTAVVEEQALDPSEIGDEEAGDAFAEAARRGGGLAALREPAASRAWRRRVARAAAEEEEGFDDGSLLADLGGEAASPAALEALLPALRRCRTAADLEAIDWIPLLSAALLTPEQEAVSSAALGSSSSLSSSSSSSSSSAPRTGGGGGVARGSPAAKGAGKKKGRPKR